MLLRRKVPWRGLASAAVLGDKVVPVAYWDQHTAHAVLNFMLRFDQRLDAGKLRDSLERLLDRRDHWRRLGGRVRRNANAKLDYHIPSKYTEQRPAITYHHKPYSTSIWQHPLASRLPKASPTSSADGPQVVARGDDLVSLMRRPEDPTSFDDYLNTDRPMLGLHIVTFTDSTLVSLCSSHILFDAMGRRELLNAWSLTLQGRDDEVLPLMETDPLESLRTDPAATTKTPAASVEKYKHADKQLGILQLLTLGVRQALDKIWHQRPVEETRIVRVPAAYVESLRQDALSVLPSQESKEAEGQTVPRSFLSDGDILCAWYTRLIVSARIRNASRSRKTIATLNMMGLRRHLSQEGLLSGPKSALVANVMVAVPTLMSAKDLVTKPLGLAAAAVRRAIGQLGTLPQVKAVMALQRAANDKKGGPPALFGNGGMHMVICTNWTKAGFYDVDFSAAIVNEDGLEQAPGGVPDADAHSHSGNESMRARPTNVHMHLFTTETPAFLVSVFSILGRDTHGNYWITGILRKGYWAKIEQALGQASDIKS